MRLIPSAKVNVKLDREELDDSDALLCSVRRVKWFGTPVAR